MRGEPSYFQRELKNWLLGLGFDQLVRENTDSIFLNKQEDTCLIIDTAICSLNDYPYVAYTSRRNDMDFMLVLTYSLKKDSAIEVVIKYEVAFVS